MHCQNCAGQVLEKNTIKPYEIKDKFCAGCGLTINSKEEFHYCPTCKNHFVCKTCRLCTSQHYMNKIVYLKNIKPIYAGNKYKCEICQKTQETNDNGIWGCVSCSYFICPDCLE